MNPVTKSYIALAIMFGCFVVLYPKVFHPWIKIIFGLNQKPTHEDPPFHPRDRAVHGMHGRENGPASRHPGARFQDEAAAKRQGTSKGGMSSFMLPVYAVGIMLYLGYTLLKIWSKRNNQNESAEDWMNAQRKRGQTARSRTPGTNPPTREQAPAAAAQPRASRPDSGEKAAGAASAANDSASLAALLRNADFDSMSYTELRALRSRLEETESRMTNLLKEVGAASKIAETLAATAADSATRAADGEADGGQTQAQRNKRTESNGEQQNSEPESDSNRKSEAEDGQRKSEAESETEKPEEPSTSGKSAAKKKKKKQKAAAKKHAELAVADKAQEQSSAQSTVRKRTGTKAQRAADGPTGDD